MSVNVGPKPVSLSCPSCHADIVTKVETSATTKTHLIAVLLCLFGCWPCVCVPYCMDSCQSKKHHCPSCGSYIAPSLPRKPKIPSVRNVAENEAFV